MGDQAKHIILIPTAYNMRAFIIASICLAAIACAELSPEGSMVTDDIKVPENSVSVTALAETEADIATSSKAKTSAGWGRRRRRRRRYVHPCQGVWNERAAKERSHKHNERVGKERRNKHNERVNKERAHKERNSKNAERSNKEKSSKERTGKERNHKEKTHKERHLKERSNKEKSAKNAERSNKERTAKERTNKERASKEKKSKEHNAKTVEKSNKEKVGKEKSSKERASKERNNKERAKKHELHNKEKAAKAKERHDKKVAKERKAKEDERRSKEITKKEKDSKERTSKERSKKAERNHKEKAHKIKVAKEQKAKEIKSKGAKHKKAVHTAKVPHDHVTIECNAHATKTAKSHKNVHLHKAEVKKAVAEGKATCKKEKKRRAAAKEKKTKMEAHGPTFNFKSKPCKGGKGSFTRKMKQNERVTVGLIPAETNNVLVKLRTDKDVDAELWTANGKREIAIVAWMVGKINSPTKASIKFAGAQINYSGYNGITNKNGMNFGHEDIGIKGQCKVGFTMKAYAFQSGTARINYSWGADPKKCERAKAAKRKEAKAKHDAKAALKHKMKEGKYKAALKVLSGGKGCKGAHKWTKSTKVRLSRAEAKHNAAKKAKALCHAKKTMSHKKYEAARSSERAFKKKHKA